MRRIKIHNFGPIKAGMIDHDGWLEIKKVTVFIGNQGSGKSTVAKLISTFSWIEKALTRGDYDIKWFTRKNRFRNTYCAYHKLENYFQEHTEITFIGNSFTMHYENGDFDIRESVERIYPLPQIMYVPAERNFISTINSPKLLKLSSESLVEFLTEFDNAKHEIKEGLTLPINNTEIEYDKLNDQINIKGEDYKVKLKESSSGFQSSVPLFLVSWFLSNAVQKTENNKEPMSSDELDRFRKGVAEIWSNESLTDEQKRAALSVLSGKFNKTAFINIVEEPEQNLFPDSQRNILNSLLQFNNTSVGNELIITTHSPYIINYLSIAIQGASLKSKMYSYNKPDHLNKLNEIVPIFSVVPDSDVVVYELNENGIIKRLPSYEGIPSDKNFLNQSLADTNQLFDALLEIEQLL
jgi:predicted ATPase